MHEARWCNREKTHSKNCARIGILKHSSETPPTNHQPRLDCWVRLRDHTATKPGCFNPKRLQISHKFFALYIFQDVLDPDLQEAIPLIYSIQASARYMQLVAIIYPRKKTTPWKSYKMESAWGALLESCQSLDTASTVDRVTYITCQSSARKTCPIRTGDSSASDLNKWQKESKRNFCAGLVCFHGYIYRWGGG